MDSSWPERLWGIIGFGRIGQATAEVALGMRMHIIPVDPIVDKATVRLGNRTIGIDVLLKTQPMNKMLSNADIITLHIPNLSKPILSTPEFRQNEGRNHFDQLRQRWYG